MKAVSSTYFLLEFQTGFKGPTVYPYSCWSRRPN